MDWTFAVFLLINLACDFPFVSGKYLQDLMLSTLGDKEHRRIDTYMWGGKFIIHYLVPTLPTYIFGLMKLSKEMRYSLNSILS